MDTNHTFGGYIWSDQPAPSHNSFASQMLGIGALGAAGAGAFGAATHTMSNNTRLVDDVINLTQFAGNLTPFQIGNTFRISEFLSTFASAKHQGLTDAGGGKYSYEWAAENLRSGDTFSYIKEATGLSTDELKARGIVSGMTGAKDEVASKLVFERGREGFRGNLFAVTGDEKRLVSSSMQLMSLGKETDLITSKPSLNKAAHAVYQSLDMWQYEKFDPKNVFAAIGADGLPVEGAKALEHMFMPSITGSVTKSGDLGRRTSYLRALPAFEMQRVNDLVSGATEQVLGKRSGEVVRGILGVGTSVRPGSASQMFGRYGALAAGIGATAMGVQQLDWARRNYGVAGDVIVAGAVSSAVGYTANKLTKSPKTAIMAGVASFFGQMLMPGFDQGVWPGIATTYANATVARASAFNPVNYYRRSLEGFAPGSTDWKTGAFLGIGVALGASVLKSPSSGKRLPQMIMDNLDPDQLSRLGLDQGMKAPRTTRDFFWDEVLQKANRGGKPGLKNVLPWDRANLVNELRQSSEFGGDKPKLTRWLNKRWSGAENASRQQSKNNPVNKALVSRLDSIAKKYEGGGILDQVAKEAEGLLTSTKYSFFGADAAEAATSKAIRQQGFKLSGKLGRTATLVGSAFIGHQLLTGGALGSMETSQQLQDQYSGKELVEVRKSRWWEGGGTPFEGGGTTYYRPHAYSLLMNRTREQGIWGEEEDKISPIAKFFKKNFTYQLEKQNYWTRPYPISTPAFGDVPIIGGLLASSIGRFIKPPKIMHASEWIREGSGGGQEFASVYKGDRREPAYRAGAQGPGIPSSPYSAANQASFLSYQFRELEGLTGWAKNVVQDKVTGSDLYGTDTPQLAESGAMTSHRTRFWESQLGGFMFSNEALRRVLPRYRSEVERQNPIMNSMASWLPDKFKYGDPYRTIEWGEARLPGSGYSSLHPELKGLDPEDYPDIYKFGILADVAPFSKEFKTAQQQMYSQRAQGRTTDAMNQYIDQVDSMTRKRYNQNEFNQVDQNAIELPGSAATQAMYLGGKQTFRDIVAPAEYLIPMGLRPAQKLLGGREMVAQYEYERMYGTPYAFWDKPWRDWFRPALSSAAHLMGYEGKPRWREKADANNEYFDKLEFMKYMTLADQASAAGDGIGARRYKMKASGTRMGVNPQGNPLGIYWSLPDADRAYFNAFAHAQGQDRQRILEMVPSDQVDLYKTVWSRIDNGDEGMWAGSPTAISDQHLSEQFYQTQNYFEGQPTPGEDWIGWHCLPAGQHVLTTLTSYSDVDVIKPGDTVWQSDVSNKVLEVFAREIDEMITEVTVSRDRVDSMKATDNHKVFAWECPWKKDHLRRRIISNRWDADNKFTPDWIRIGDLSEGDYLVIPCPGITRRDQVVLDLVEILQHVPNLKYDEEHVWTYFKDKEKASTCKRYLELTPQVAWVVGYYLAEGHVGKRSGYSRYVEWTSHLKESYYRATLCESLSIDFDVSFQYRERYRKTGDSASVRSHGVIGEVFSYFAPGIHNTKRLVHGDILLTSPGHAEAFLAGLYAGDGTKEPSCSTLTTTSEVLHRQVKEILISCGIVPSVSCLAKREGRKTSYQVRFVRSTDAACRIHDGVADFQFEVKDISPAKPKAFVKGGYLYSRISRVEKIHYEGLVYDMNIESVHAYRTSIGLYHNSDVDMNDIQVRYVDQIGGELHDYGLWESQLKQSMGQEFLEGSTGFIHEQGGINNGIRAKLAGDVYALTRNDYGGASHLSVHQGGGRDNALFTYDDSRTGETISRLKDMLNGY